MKPIELLQLSALQQAEAIRSGTVSSVELTQLYLERIEKYNRTLNAFVSVNGRRALKAARKADEARRQKGWNGGPLFHGVPTGIKDLVPVAGTPTRLGSRAYRYVVSPFNGPVVRLLRAGGLISLGKLATSEFGVLPVTEPDIHPPTRNPWDLGRTSGDRVVVQVPRSLLISFPSPMALMGAAQYAFHLRSAICLASNHR